MTQLPLKQDIKELQELASDGWSSVGENMWVRGHMKPVRRDTALRLKRLADDLLGPTDQPGLKDE